MNGVVEQIVTPQVAALAAGIVAILWGVGMVRGADGTKLADRAWWRRVLPLVPLLLGVAGAFMPGVIPDAVGWGAQVLAGLLAGFTAAHGRKVVRRVVMGRMNGSDQ